MTRENKYKIEILFDTDARKKNMFTGNVPYYGSSTFSDKFDISFDKIIIEANRSASIPLESIFYNHYSSLYNQILKALLFYYSASRKYVKIKIITISRARSKKTLETKYFKERDFKQVLDSSFKLAYTLEHNSLLEMFNETAKGQTVLIAISYILKANSGLNESDKFEKLWKAFNKLFILIGGDKKDYTCLRNLRQFILTNSGVLTLSTRLVNKLDKDKLRKAIRWRAMLLDNYDTEAKTESFKNFVLRYNDKRIMEILKETNYGYREEFLRKKGFFIEVDNHIKKSISASLTNNDEIVTLLTGKYMYFVRNKTFHGEKVDSSFRLSVNKEDIEMKFLNSILESYLIDLINANNLY